MCGHRRGSTTGSSSGQSEIDAMQNTHPPDTPRKPAKSPTEIDRCFLCRNDLGDRWENDWRTTSVRRSPLRVSRDDQTIENQRLVLARWQNTVAG